MHHYWLSQYIKAIVLHQENLNLNFGQSENFILFSRVLFHPPSWIIVQSDGYFSICHLEFLSNHRPSCHPELLSNQKAAFHLPSCIFDQSETTCPPHTPLGIEVSLLHYSHTFTSWLICTRRDGRWDKLPVSYPHIKEMRV